MLEVAAQPGSLTAILTADGGTGSGLAAVSAAGEVTIAMQALAPTSGSQVYTAWVIAGTAAPVPLGSFTVGNDGTAVVRGHRRADASGARPCPHPRARPGCHDAHDADHLEGRGDGRRLTRHDGLAAGAAARVAAARAVA